LRSVPSTSTPPLRLVEGATDEPAASLDEVYRKYGRYVAAVILRLDGRNAEVEDLVQDVFVEAARGIRRLREADAIRGWLATIAVRTVRRRLRLRRAFRFLGLDAGQGGHCPFGACTRGALPFTCPAP